MDAHTAARVDLVSECGVVDLSCTLKVLSGPEQSPRPPIFLIVRKWVGAASPDMDDLLRPVQRPPMMGVSEIGGPVNWGSLYGPSLLSVFFVWATQWSRNGVRSLVYGTDFGCVLHAGF